MKKSIQNSALAIIIILSLFICGNLKADPPAPPPPDSHGSSNNGPPVGAPIDGGLGILMAMGTAYGARKLWQKRYQKVRQEEKA